jgi:hypothetical protein
VHIGLGGKVRARIRYGVDGRVLVTDKHPHTRRAERSLADTGCGERDQLTSVEAAMRPFPSSPISVVGKTGPPAEEPLPRGRASHARSPPSRG